MQTAQHFASDILATLDQTDEVQIRPRLADRPVTIWVVVLDGQDVYVRSYRGLKGRWFQALLNEPHGVLLVGRREIPVRAVPVDDAQTIARVSEAYQRKYGHRWPTETDEMLRHEVLATTLRLEPAGSAD
jgi:hypothetical protein